MGINFIGNTEAGYVVGDSEAGLTVGDKELGLTAVGFRAFNFELGLSEVGKGEMGAIIVAGTVEVRHAVTG